MWRPQNGHKKGECVRYTTTVLDAPFILMGGPLFLKAFEPFTHLHSDVEAFLEGDWSALSKLPTWAQVYVVVVQSFNHAALQLEIALSPQPIFHSAELDQCSLLDQCQKSCWRDTR